MYIYVDSSRSSLFFQLPFPVSLKISRTHHRYYRIRFYSKFPRKTLKVEENCQLGNIFRAIYKNIVIRGVEKLSDGKQQYLADKNLNDQIVFLANIIFILQISNYIRFIWSCGIAELPLIVARLYHIAHTQTARSCYIAFLLISLEFTCGINTPRVVLIFSKIPSIRAYALTSLIRRFSIIQPYKIIFLVYN